MSNVAPDNTSYQVPGDKITYQTVLTVILLYINTSESEDKQLLSVRCHNTATK